jgi:hypothetical protein
MPVTFGTVQLVPATPPAAGGGAQAAAPGAAQQPPDPRDLKPVLHHLHERASRVRAH